MGGDISLISYPMRGTIFTFHIKVLVDHLLMQSSITDIEESEFTSLLPSPTHLPMHNFAMGNLRKSFK
jgi:hypothetical protein